MKRALIGFSLITIALFFFTSVISCSNGSMYKEATVTKAGVTFSFEYPSSYKDSMGTLLGNIDDMVMLHIGANVTDDRWLGIIVYHQGRFYPGNFSNAAEELEYNLDLMNGWGPENEFKLLGISDVQVDGIPCKMLATRSQFDPENPSKYGLMTAREIYFDKDEQLWNIVLFSRAASANQAGKDFNGIIKSFKFLN
jgi:hypothetical protein